jgi:SAM-dependent methyltransferase
MLLGMTTPPSAEHFDRWYADMSMSSAHEAVVMRTLGLPPALESTSLLPWTASPMWRPRWVSVRWLTGIDFSQVAVNRAREKASGGAEFRVGELTATGLPDGTAAAVMCIDAMQFAEPLSAGFAEAYRVLRPGGRLVLTGWQALDADDEVVSARLRQDIGAAMAEAGFVDVAVMDMPGWKAAERALWEAAVALDPAGDPALESLRDEGERVLPQIDNKRRVLALGRTPDSVSSAASAARSGPDRCGASTR